MKQKLLLFSIIFFLVSCATQPALPPPATPVTKSLWETHYKQLNAIKSWHMNGRIAVITATENWTANVHWQQRASTYQLIFKAPLGQSTMSLEGNQYRVVMRTTDGEEIEENNPDVLIAKVMDLHIPVTGLYFWIRGVPAPRPVAKQYRLDEAGYLYSLQQDGWKIAYKRYVDVAGISLPDKIFLENKHFRVKIAVSRWDLSP